MMFRSSPVAAALGLVWAATAVQAQDSTVKVGLTRYDTHSRTSGISGIGVPPGSDAVTGDATTLLVAFERLLNPNLGVELAVGLPPRIKARATGPMSFLGEVLSAKNLAPTVLVNYHFGQPGVPLRPYVGAGINFTRFVGVRTTLPASVHLSDSVGLALQGGVDYAIDRQWGLFASVAALKVKTDLVAVGSTVLTTTIDFRPVVYSAGLTFRF